MIRVKTNWFKPGREKTPQELAGAVAFIAWRIAENMLKKLRRADFEIAIGAPYFSFLGECLVFLVQVADRIAYRCFTAEFREAFTIELAQRIAANFAENRQRLLGDELAVAKAVFIELLNRRAAGYAEFEFEEGAGNFSFLRYFVHSVSGHLDEKDCHWVSDQIIAIEAPDAVATVEKAMRGLLGKEPGKRRAGGALGGD